MLGMLAQLTVRAVCLSLIPHSQTPPPAVGHLSHSYYHARLREVAIETFEQTRLSHHFVAASGPRRHPSIPMLRTRVGIETTTYMSAENVEYLAINASPSKDDKDQPAGKLPSESTNTLRKFDIHPS